RRLDWPHLRTDAHAGRGWSSWTRGVVRLRWLAVVVALAILIPLGVAGLHLRLGEPQSNSLASSGPAREGLVQLERAGFPTGVLTPLDILVPAAADPDSLAARLVSVPGVFAATAPADPDWHRAGTALVTVLPKDETGTSTGRDTIARVRSAVH